MSEEFGGERGREGEGKGGEREGYGRSRETWRSLGGGVEFEGGGTGDGVAERAQARMYETFAAILDEFHGVLHERRDAWADRFFPVPNQNVGQGGGQVAVQGQQKVQQGQGQQGQQGQQGGQGGAGGNQGGQGGNQGNQGGQQEATRASSVAEYSVAAAEIGLILWASPELRKGFTPLTALVPGALSLLDNGWNKDSAKRAVIPGAIGLASAVATSRFLR